MQYRIAWEYIENGTKGNGDYCLSKESAERWIADLNVKYHNVINHWIEPEPEPSTDPCTHGA
jgi:hypothetical protein